MPTAIAQNEMDHLIADAVKSWITSKTLKLWGYSTSPTHAETTAYASTPSGVDADLYSSGSATLGTVASLTVSGQGTTWSLPVTGLTLTNHNASAKNVYGVLLVDDSDSKCMYMLLFDTPFYLAAGASLPVDMTLWFNTAPYS